MYTWQRISLNASDGVPNAHGPSHGYFAATCYFFALQLHDGLRDSGASRQPSGSVRQHQIYSSSPVPIGVLTVAWSGNPIEAFMSPEAGTRQTPKYLAILYRCEM